MFPLMFRKLLIQRTQLPCCKGRSVLLWMLEQLEGSTQHVERRRLYLCLTPVPTCHNGGPRRKTIHRRRTRGIHALDARRQHNRYTGNGTHRPHAPPQNAAGSRRQRGIPKTHEGRKTTGCRHDDGTGHPRNQLEKQLLAEPEPINVAAWDEAIITDFGHTDEDIEPTDLHTQPDTMDMDGQPDKTTNDMDKPAVTHPRPTHQAQKTKAHNKTPQTTPTKTTPPPPKKSNPGVPTVQPRRGRGGRIHSRHQT